MGPLSDVSQSFPPAGDRFNAPSHCIHLSASNPSSDTSERCPVDHTVETVQNPSACKGYRSVPDWLLHVLLYSMLVALERGSAVASRLSERYLTWARWGANCFGEGSGWTCESTIRSDTSFVVDPLAEGGASRSAWRARSLGEATPLPPDCGHRSIHLRAGAYALRPSLLLTSAADGLAILASPGERATNVGPRGAPAAIFRHRRDVELAASSLQARHRKTGSGRARATVCSPKTPS